MATGKTRPAEWLAPAVNVEATKVQPFVVRESGGGLGSGDTRLPTPQSWKIWGDGGCGLTPPHGVPQVDLGATWVELSGKKNRNCKASPKILLKFIFDPCSSWPIFQPIFDQSLLWPMLHFGNLQVSKEYITIQPRPASQQPFSHPGPPSQGLNGAHLGRYGAPLWGSGCSSRQ